ncbi:MAG: response regulator [Planctomycetes bacterium]|nr:response regulator [Planctomycetota bacterium]MBI3843006.1 response regulator [Planctomycetota bacterium]
MRAIVIDDSEAIRRILRNMMTAIGFEVIEAKNGRDALDRLATIGCVDVALVDWNMPDLNGYEFVVAVRADPTLNGMRLMMVTSETELQSVAAALNAGADEYVMKPFTKDVILEKLALLGIGQS